MRFLVAAFAMLLCLTASADSNTGNCSRTAAYYQSQYQTGKNVADLVCLQTATRRELQISSDDATVPPAANVRHSEIPTRPLTSVETWCADQESRQPFDICVKMQNAAKAKIDRFLALDKGSSHRNHETRSACSFYLTGGGGGGSMGLEDLVPIASCIDFSPEKSEAMYQECASMVTGDSSGQTGRPAIGRDKVLNSTDRIKMCFLSRLP